MDVGKWKMENDVSGNGVGRPDGLRASYGCSSIAPKRTPPMKTLDAQWTMVPPLLSLFSFPSSGVWCMDG